MLGGRGARTLHALYRTVPVQTSALPTRLSVALVQRQLVLHCRTMSASAPQPSPEEVKGGTQAARGVTPNEMATARFLFDLNGFVVVKQALSPQHVDALNGAIDRHAAEFKSRTVGLPRFCPSCGRARSYGGCCGLFYGECSVLGWTVEEILERFHWINVGTRGSWLCSHAPHSQPRQHRALACAHGLHFHCTCLVLTIPFQSLILCSSWLSSRTLDLAPFERSITAHHALPPQPDRPELRNTTAGTPLAGDGVSPRRDLGGMLGWPQEDAAPFRELLAHPVLSRWVSPALTPILLGGSSALGANERGQTVDVPDFAF